MLRTVIPDSAASCSIVIWLGDSEDGAYWRAEDTPRLKLASEQLARRRPWQPVREHDLLGHLERRKSCRAMGLESIRGRGNPISQNHRGYHRLPPLRVRPG